MLFRIIRLRKLIISLILSLSALFLISAMLIWPKDTYDSARYGLDLWATVLVPSMLPFFIMSEVLLNLGIVKILGVLLEPVMRPLFNLPGPTSFALAMGFTSGFPMGAILTRRLCEEGFCTSDESERLVAFTNNSSPLFILAAVGAGMFNDPALGLLLAVSHYLSNLLLGMILGLLSHRAINYVSPLQNTFKAGVANFLIQQKERKPLGTILGSAVKTGISNIFTIGGFVIFFAVLTKILSISGALSCIAMFFMYILNLCGFDVTINESLAIGFWEMTLGLKNLSLQNLSFQTKAVAGSIILGWSGLSIQAQVISFISGSGIKPRLYYCCRILQALLSAIIAYIFSLNTELWSGLIVFPAFSGLQPLGHAPLNMQDKVISSFFFSLNGFIFIAAALFALLLFFSILRLLKKRLRI